MLTFSCQSGSNGNCIFVQAGQTRLLIDAGISGRRAEERLAVHGENIRDVDALLISHDHGDHSSSAGVFQRKFGLPIYATGGTYQACRHRLGDVGDVRCFHWGDRLEIGEATVYTLPTPHDGTEGVCYVIEHGGKRLGVLTDLGYVFDRLDDVLAGVDGVYIESNYDPAMLRRGPYPLRLQNRVSGSGGHLANEQAAALLAETGERLQWAVLAHISAENNTPELALRTVRDAQRRPLPIHVASRSRVSDVFEVA